MSSRDECMREHLNKKLVNKKITKAVQDVDIRHEELKQIQEDFEPNFIPIRFIIVEHDNIYFARPSITINELLNSESLKNRTKNECIKVDIDSTLFGPPSIIPRINGSRTVEEWIRTNEENFSSILFTYQTEI
ncbi:unnamed protein product [Adineta ricciae]|uniref:Uncharacterized protein n=1 Tax=Adineta ricciae TaxID=249248 RepID=A0A814PPH0_ADIRI|nr:unnamed protein product [Adineta ricciae]CAF1299574.1 unnamed protein product [Adineta ricciae]